MKLLAIFAHPDDESFGPGGTLALAAANGFEVGLITLTKGEAGSLGISKTLSANELARRRTGELHCATKKLGIKHLIVHQFPDNKLTNIPQERGAEIITKEVQKFSPDILITFHKNGISGHPDHKAVTKWTDIAVRRLDNPPKFLCYGLVKTQTKQILNRKLYPINERDVTHKIDVSTYIKKKIDAIQCHKTQQELWKNIEKMGKDFYPFARWEYFTQVWPQYRNGLIKHHLL